MGTIFSDQIQLCISILVHVLVQMVFPFHLLTVDVMPFESLINLGMAQHHEPPLARCICQYYDICDPDFGTQNLSQIEIAIYIIYIYRIMYNMYLYNLYNNV